MLRRRWWVALVVAAGLLSSCGGTHGGPFSVHTVSQVGLKGCHMTVEVFAMDRPRFRHLVPGRYLLGAYTGAAHATLVFWVIACDSVRVGHSPGQRAILSLVGVQVKSPLHPSSPAAPGVFDHYLLFAHSNDRALTAALSRGGLPVDYVAGMRFARKRMTTTGVPWKHGPYGETVSTRVFQPAHDHDNSYWRDGSDGAIRLRVRFYDATDRACGECMGSGVFAHPGSPIAQLIGGSELKSPFVAFDHNKIARGDITLFPPQRPEARPIRQNGLTGFLGTEGVTITPALVRATRGTRRPVPARRGVVVTNVLPSGPAAAAGIRAHDVILAIDGLAIHDFPQLVRQVGRIRPGTRVVITILREGRHRRVPVLLGQRPASD